MMIKYAFVYISGMMVECLKHEGTSHSSSDLLKICVKMGASWSAQDFRQTGAFFPFLLPEDLAHLVFADLNFIIDYDYIYFFFH